jgi:putative thioredoxin
MCRTLFQDPAPDMSHAIDITAANFETEAIAASMHTPVLIDFWAPWCGPCRTLGPILDKLAAEFAGRLKVVKVNTDDEMQLASVFGIRSLPTVMLLKGGQPVDGFMGLQPEGAIRQWLAPHLGDGAPPVEDESAAEAEAEPAAPEVTPQEALATARRQLAAEPDKPEHRLALVEALIGTGDLDEAQSRLGELSDTDGQSDRARRAKALLEFHYIAQRAPTVSELDARLQSNPDDHEARHLLGVRLLLDGDAPAALDAFLELMRRDRAYGDDLGRRSLVQAFPVVADEDLVGQTRRRMSSLLF